MLPTAAPSGNVFPSAGHDVDAPPGRVEPVGRVVVDVEVGQVQVGVPGSEGVVVELGQPCGLAEKYRGQPTFAGVAEVQRPGVEQLRVPAVVDVELLAEGERARAELIGVVGAGKGSRFGEFFEGVEPIVGRGRAEQLDRFGQDRSGLVVAAGVAEGAAELDHRSGDTLGVVEFGIDLPGPFGVGGRLLQRRRQPVCGLGGVEPQPGRTSPIAAAASASSAASR